MFDRYEELPEWLRWVLFLPLFLLTTIILGFILRIVNAEWQGAFLFERVFFPFIGAGTSVFVIMFLIPRAKRVAAYLLLAMWAAFGALAVIALFLPSMEGGMTWRELVQCAFGLAGSVVAMRMVQE